MRPLAAAAYHPASQIRQFMMFPGLKLATPEEADFIVLAVEVAVCEYRQSPGQRSSQ
jgi:hypothetical protein